MVKCEVAKKDFETIALGAFATPGLLLAPNLLRLAKGSELNR
jgi:hypothetical protein